MNFYQKTGELIIGSRLKRLSEKFLMEIAKIYDSLDIDFEISWFPIFFLLNENKELTVTEIAREMEITHSAVSQLITAMQKRGLVELNNPDNDKRKKIVSLTKDGHKLLKKVKPVWESIKRIYQKFLSEGQYSSYFLSSLSEIEDKLKNTEIKNLVLQDLEKTTTGIPVITEFRNEFLEQYKAFLLEWVMEHEEDSKEADLLSNPQFIVQDQKGSVFLAELNGKVIGAIVTKYQSENTAELLFLLVDEEWQNRKIGTLLLQETIQKLKANNFSKLSAAINKNKTKAVKVLRDSGFVLESMKTIKNEKDLDVTMLILENSLIQ